MEENKNWFPVSKTRVYFLVIALIGAALTLNYVSINSVTSGGTSWTSIFSLTTFLLTPILIIIDNINS